LKDHVKVARSSWNPFRFRNLVRGHGEWDLKNNAKTIYGVAAKFDQQSGTSTKFSFEGKNYTAEELGNFHYGVVGKAWNNMFFTDTYLLKKAGEAQIAAETSRPEWQRYDNEYVYPGQYEKKVEHEPYGDDPHDQEMIKAGFKYYADHKKE
jgi:hypothetical protein